MTLAEFVLPEIPLAAFWMAVGIAVLLQGIGKSGFAGGAGSLAVPLMLLVMPVEKTAAVLLPLLILADLNAIYHHRHNRDWAKIRAVYLPCVLGVFAGAAVWWYVGEGGVDRYAVPLKRFVGVIALVFALYVVAKETAMAWVARYRPGTFSAIAAGTVAGFTSTLAHAAGPIISLYMFAHGLPKTLFVGTVAWTFTLINLTKLPFYIAVGLIQPDTLLFGLIVLPLAPLGSWLGITMHHRVSESLFNRIITVLAILASLQLIANINLIALAYQTFS